MQLALLKELPLWMILIVANIAIIQKVKDDNRVPTQFFLMFCYFFLISGTLVMQILLVCGFSFIAIYVKEIIFTENPLQKIYTNFFEKLLISIFIFFCQYRSFYIILYALIDAILKFFLFEYSSNLYTLTSMLVFLLFLSRLKKNQFSFINIDQAIYIIEELIEKSKNIKFRDYRYTYYEVILLELNDKYFWKRRSYNPISFICNIIYSIGNEKNFRVKKVPTLIEFTVGEELFTNMCSDKKVRMFIFKFLIIPCYFNVIYKKNKTNFANINDFKKSIIRMYFLTPREIKNFGYLSAYDIINFDASFDNFFASEISGKYNLLESKKIISRLREENNFDNFISYIKVRQIINFQHHKKLEKVHETYIEQVKIVKNVPETSHLYVDGFQQIYFEIKLSQKANTIAFPLERCGIYQENNTDVFYVSVEGLVGKCGVLLEQYSKNFYFSNNEQFAKNIKIKKGHEYNSPFIIPFNPENIKEVLITDLCKYIDITHVEINISHKYRYNNLENGYLLNVIINSVSRYFLLRPANRFTNGTIMSIDYFTSIHDDTHYNAL